MKRVCRSFSTILGVVPEAISAWKPESAPHAMVTNRNGNSEPGHTGPVWPEANSENAGVSMRGCTTTMAIARPAITPIFMKVDR